MFESQLCVRHSEYNSDQNKNDHPYDTDVLGIMLW